MIDFSKIKSVYFIGIGGIGTSAVVLQRRTGAMFLRYIGLEVVYTTGINITATARKSKGSFASFCAMLFLPSP